MINIKYHTLYLLFISLLLVTTACDETNTGKQPISSNNPEVLYKLAQDYLNQSQGNNDVEKAFQILTQLAENEYALAQNKLGYLYSQGQWVDKNPVIAHQWYSRAALSGFAVSQYNLAEMERFGIGTEVNESAAFLWYEKSAFQGYPNAILRMIEAYSNGIGISHNPVKAYAWHQIALAHGLQLPESMLPSQVKNISSEEMSEAESIIQNIQWEMAVNK